jgi:hypothetical protein
LGADHSLFATRCERKIRNIRIGNKHNVCNSGAIEIGVHENFSFSTDPFTPKFQIFSTKTKLLSLCSDIVA